MTFIKGERRIGWGKLREKILGYSLTGKWVPNLQRLDDKSRMSRDVHVRICESVRVKSPRATRPFWADIHLGFGFWTRQKLRLRGLDAPEIESAEGKEAKEFVQKKLKSATVIIKTVKSDKYDRYLADVWVGNTYLNQELLDKDLAVRVND